MTKSDEALLALVKANLNRLCLACWFASEWQAFSADADRNRDPQLSEEALASQERFLQLQKALKRYRERP